MLPNSLPFDNPFTYEDNDPGVPPKITGASISKTYTYDISDKTGQKNFADSYNSKKGYRIDVNSSGPITITWTNVAKDKASGRMLNETWTLNDIVPALGAFNGSGDWSNNGTWMCVYSNSLAKIDFDNIAAMRVKVNMTYADNGATYDKPYMVNWGSLNRWNPNGTWKGTTTTNAANAQNNHMEYVTPISGVHRAYESTDTWLNHDEEQLYGPCTKLDQKGYYMAKYQTTDPLDYNSQSLSQEGISFIADNGATFDIGISTEPGANSHCTYYDHVISDVRQSVPSMTPPTPPTLDPVKATYWYDQADLPNASAEWHLTDINSVPEDKKGVEAGTTDGSTQSINGDGCFLG